MSTHAQQPRQPHPDRVETVVIGAGQAGLATGHHLQRRGRPFVILDSVGRVGDGWRQQWDTLRLYSPARYDGLPGMPFPGKPWVLPTKDELADYLEAYADRFALPLRLRTTVRALDPDTDGGFLVRTTDGTISCDNVVVATGSFGRSPRVPELAPGLDPGILQLHSSEYRRPAQLPDGPVLVVGASHSGCDIAYEVAASRPTTLVGRDCGSIPMRPEDRRTRVLFPIIAFAWRHLLTRRTPMGRKEMPKARFHGGPMLRVKSSDLVGRGVVRNTSRVEGVRDGRPVLTDGTVLDPSTVIWATGFRQVFDWIHLPVIGADGWPREYRGVVDEAPGLFFCGLSFQYAFSSMVLAGVGRDAEYVACRIDDRTRAARKGAVAAGAA